MATLVNGLTLAILVGCSPFLVPVAAVAGIAAFQALFRLSVAEAFLTGGALGGLSIFVNLIALATVLKFLLA